MGESSVSSGDEDKLEGTEKALSREKKNKKVDIAKPLSTFEKQNHQRKQHFTTSAFVKEKWLYLRDMNGDGKFVTEDDARTDMWKHVAKSDRLLKKYAGDVFADTQFDEGLHSIADKDVTAEERAATEFLKQHNTVSYYSWPNLP